MSASDTAQGTIIILGQVHLETWIESFLVDRQAQSFSPGTIEFYRKKLTLLTHYCEGRAIVTATQLTSDELRRFMLWLTERGHNEGGVHACYRAVRAFLRWLWDELDLSGKPPTAKVKAPKLPSELLEPVALPTVDALLKVCGKDNLGLRDKAIFLTLLDTGLRASELIALDTASLNPVSGAVTVRRGKGKKDRLVFLGQTSRKAVRAYLRTREDNCPALFASETNERLSYWGLRSMTARRSKQAGIEAPDLHSFRRAFALNCLRAGMDIYTLQEIMGHADLQVLRRYLKQEPEDLQAAHARFSPADSLSKRAK